MVIKTETFTSTLHHDIFTYLDYIFSCYLHTVGFYPYLLSYIYIYIYIYLRRESNGYYDRKSIVNPSSNPGLGSLPFTDTFMKDMYPIIHLPGMHK